MKTLFRLFYVDEYFLMWKTICKILLITWQTRRSDRERGALPWGASLHTTTTSRSLAEKIGPGAPAGWARALLTGWLRIRSAEYFHGRREWNQWCWSSNASQEGRNWCFIWILYNSTCCQISLKPCWPKLTHMELKFVHRPQFTLSCLWSSKAKPWKWHITYVDVKVTWKRNCWWIRTLNQNVFQSWNSVSEYDICPTANYKWLK